MFERKKPYYEGGTKIDLHEASIFRSNLVCMPNSVKFEIARHMKATNKVYEIDFEKHAVKC